MAGNRVASARRIDDDVRPHHDCRNFYRCHLRNGDALFCAAKQAGFHSAHTQAVDNDFCWEDEIAFGPAAGGEGFAWTDWVGTLCYTHSSAPFFQSQM